MKRLIGLVEVFLNFKSKTLRLKNLIKKSKDSELFWIKETRILTNKETQSEVKKKDETKKNFKFNSFIFYFFNLNLNYILFYFSIGNKNSRIPENRNHNFRSRIINQINFE
jgi:hypothetical protein